MLHVMTPAEADAHEALMKAAWDKFPGWVIAELQGLSSYINDAETHDEASMRSAALVWFLRKGVNWDKLRDGGK